MIKNIMIASASVVISVSAFAASSQNSVKVFSQQVNVDLPVGYKEVSHQKEKYRDVWAYENKTSEVDYTRYLVGGYKVNPYSQNKSFSVVDSVKKEALSCNQDFTSVVVPNGYVTKCGSVEDAKGVKRSVVVSEKFVTKNGVNYAVKYFKYGSPTASALTSVEASNAEKALAVVVL